MSVTFEAHEVARSHDVFTAPSTYGRFDLTSDHRRMVGCIDPRDEDRADLQIIVQTPGGAAGKGFDAALALTAYDPDNRIHTIQQGLRYDSDLQRATVAGAHRGCRFVMGLAQVAAEMTAPSDITNDTFRGLVGRYELKDTGIQENRTHVIEAANRLQDQVAACDPEELLEDVNRLYPYHVNVIDMKGDNTAGSYILNHHPYVGLDRSVVHRGENPLTVQAYHDNVRASMESLMGTVGMPADVKALRLAALLMRTAATRTVLCTGSPRMQYLHVVPTSRGLQVEQEYI
ncbi:MAG: hypothetical protein AAB834_01195 [Patescibacteria group bacterium]